MSSGFGFGIANKAPVSQRISIFGLGYVGAVSAGCFAAMGHRVIGVDTQASKVHLLNAGRSPVAEVGLAHLIAEAARADALHATSDSAYAVGSSDLSLICVGTPSRPDGGIDIGFLSAACHQIGAGLRQKVAYHTVVIRSTVVPGVTRQILIPALEAASGRQAGVDFGVSMHPEFLREGTAIADFDEPSRVVIGQLDERSGRAVTTLYAPSIDGQLARTSLETAETIKYVDNAWHALKVCFANEIAAVCEAADVNPQQIMEMFCQDRKLNISAAYLRPGPAFGGSCLPKDLRALMAWCQERQISTPLLSAVLPSNAMRQERALATIRATGASRIGFLGLAFKAGTDDVRESPAVTLVQRLVREGYEVLLHDEHVKLDQMIGANQHYLLSLLPDFDRYARPTVAQVIASADVLVVNHDLPMYRDALSSRRAGVTVIDLAGCIARAAVEPFPTRDQFESGAASAPVR